MTPATHGGRAVKLFPLKVALFNLLLTAAVSGLIASAPRCLSADLRATAGRKDYAACYAAVLRGETVYLVVGVAPEKGDYAAAETPDRRPAGRYKCWRLADGSPWMEPVGGMAPPPAAAAPRLFQPFGGFFAPGCVGNT